MEAPIVTLTTDWGDKDFFAAKVKGRLYSAVEGIRVVDLSHHQAWGDLPNAVGVVRYGCSEFPKGTIHIIDVSIDISVWEKPSVPVPVLARYAGSYYLSTDRRILEQSFDEPCDEIVELPLPDSPIPCTFLAYTLFCDAVAKLIEGRPLSDIGVACEPLRRRGSLVAQQDGDTLVAVVSSIDGYGNASLNVGYDDFMAFAAGRRFHVELEWSKGNRERYEVVTGISQHYNDVQKGSLLLTQSITGMLQLAINQGSVAQLIGMRYNSPCRFVFK